MVSTRQRENALWCFSSIYRCKWQSSRRVDIACRVSIYLVSVPTIALHMLSKRKTAVAGESVSRALRGGAINQNAAGCPAFWCTWRQAKTRLGAALTMAFSVEADVLLLLCTGVYMLSQLRYIHFVAGRLSLNSIQLPGDTNLPIVYMAMGEGLHQTNGDPAPATKMAYWKFMSILTQNNPYLCYLCLGAVATSVVNVVRPDRNRSCTSPSYTTPCCFIRGKFALGQINGGSSSWPRCSLSCAWA
jgi:hypothetical protein